jgi:nicotinamidase-related amidase
MADRDQSAIRSLVGRLPDPTLDPATTALVVIDLQRLDADPDGAHGVRAREHGVWDDFAEYFERVGETVVPAVAAIAEDLHAAGGTVAWVRCQATEPDASDTRARFRAFDIVIPPGDPQAEFLAALPIADGDLIVDKTTASPFNSTDLTAQLRERGVTAVLVAGVVTSGCVESTVRDASDLDFEVVLVEDGCADRRPAAHADAIARLDGNFATAWTSDTTRDRLRGGATTEQEH